MFLTETWLNPDIDDSEIFLGSSYITICRTDRERRQHGGLLIAQSANDPLKAMNTTIPSFEFAVSCVVLSEQPSFFVLIYNPPMSSIYSVNIQLLLNCIESYLLKIEEILQQYGYGNTYNFYLLGDFNFPSIDWNTYSSSSTNERSFLEIIIENGFLQFVTEATHKNKNILDLVISNEINLPVSVGNQIFSDHYPIFFNFNSVHPTCELQSSYSKSSFNIQTFNTYLQSMYNLVSLNSCTIESYADKWYSLLNSSFKSAIKLKRSKRKVLPIFYSSHTVHLINQKETTLRKLKKENSYLQAIKLKDITRYLSESIELDKEVFINQFNLSSTSECFKLLKTLGYNSALPSIMYHGNISLTTELEKATGFNKFFASVFNDQEMFTLPDLFSNVSICLNDLNLSLPDIESFLNYCPDTSNTGPDNIPSFVLSHCSDIISPLVYDLFAWILKHKNWPSQWKTSFVTPLYKSDARNDITNYRPISILPRISLILERILFNFTYPKVRHLIKRQQHGFMKSRSTISQLIIYLDSIYSSCDKNSPGLAIYFDVRKAFDSVPHHLLLAKLVILGFDFEFLQLFESYLTNRYQCVVINQSISSPLPVTSGVPQGSVLGPLLFILFINDMTDDVLNSEFYLFADDLKIKSSSAPSLVQKDIDSLFNWSTNNHLQFHSAKCKVLNFGGYDDSIQFLLGSDILPFVDEIKDLGIIVSNNLSWKSHLNTKLIKCSRLFYFLKRNIPFSVSCSRKKLLYNTLILSILLYGAPAWCPSLTLLHQLELFQYKVLRWIKKCSSYVSGLLNLNMLPISYVLIRVEILLLWKLHNNVIDVDCKSATSSLPTRSATSGLFVIPNTRKLKTDDNFFVRAPRAANELLRLKIISFDMPLGMFKSKLNKFLLLKTSTLFDINRSCTFFVKCFCKNCRS